MARLLRTRVIRHRVEQDQWGHDIAVPCLVRAYVKTAGGREFFFSGSTESAAVLSAADYFRGQLQYDYTLYE